MLFDRFIINDETAEFLSNIIKDGIEVIQLLKCDLTNQAIATIMGKLKKLISPVILSCRKS